MRVKIITKATGKVREVELLPGQTLTIADGEQLLIPENWVVSRQGDTVVVRDPADSTASTATVRLEDSSNGLVFADAGASHESGLGAGALWLLGGAAGAGGIALAAGGGGGAAVPILGIPRRPDRPSFLVCPRTPTSLVTRSPRTPRSR